MKKFNLLLGTAIGAVNSFFGSGGGLLAVPYLKKAGLTQQQAQASSICVILPLCIISSFLFCRKIQFDFEQFIPLFAAGVVGALCGGVFLKKIPSKWLKFVFSAFMLYAGVRMIMNAS